MKKYSTYIIAFLWMALFPGCSDFLEKEYDLTTSEESIFINPTLTRDFLTNLYTFLPDGVGIYADNQFTGASRDCMTDNSVSYWDLHYYGKISIDSYTALDHPLNYFWGSYCTAIRRANKFLANISDQVISNATVSGDENKLYERYRAEAIFLRALYHFELVAYFGDVPLLYDREAGAGINPVTEQDFGIILDMENPETLNLYRDNAAEVLEWVAQQCDYVKDVLPFRYSSEGNWGRVNGASAYALKSRALLYRASALNNPTNDRTHWTNAAQAAQDFITKNNSSGRAFELYKNTSSSSATGTDHYGECFYATPYNNNEIILSRSIWHTNAVETNLIPPGFSGGAGRTNPTQNFVDAFEMANGKFIDESGSGYDPQKPYDNRDPRLKATVFAHGDVWGRADYNEQRTIDVSDGGPDYRGGYGWNLYRLLS